MGVGGISFLGKRPHRRYRTGDFWNGTSQPFKWGNILANTLRTETLWRAFHIFLFVALQHKFMMSFYELIIGIVTTMKTKRCQPM
jgi:hypothetical protein